MLAKRYYDLYKKEGREVAEVSVALLLDSYNVSVEELQLEIKRIFLERDKFDPLKTGL